MKRLKIKEATPGDSFKSNQLLLIITALALALNAAWVVYHLARAREPRVFASTVPVRSPAPDEAPLVNQSPPVAQDLERSRTIEGKYWLEMAKREAGHGNHMTSAMMAGRAVGFVGFGAKDEEMKNPRLLRPQHQKAFQEAVSIANDQWARSPTLLWRNGSQSHHGTKAVHVVFSPDGKWLASLGKDSGFIQIWDVQTGELRDYNMQTPHDAIQPIFSPDGKKLAYRCESAPQVRIYDLELREETTIHVPGEFGLTEQLPKVEGIQFHAKEPTLLIQSGHHVLFWNYSESKPLGERRNFENQRLHEARFDPSGTKLALTFWRSNMEIWKYEMGKLENRIEIDPTKATSVEIKALVRDNPAPEAENPGVSPMRFFFPDEKTVATSFKNHPVLDIWDLETGNYIRKSVGANPVVFDVNKDQKFWLARAPGDRATTRILIHRTDSGKDDYELVTKVEFGYQHSALSPDGSKIAVGFNGGGIRIFDMVTREWLSPPRKEFAHDGMTRVLFSPDGRKLISSSRKMVKVWSAASGEIELSSTAAYEAVPGSGIACLSDDGSLVAFTKNHDFTDLFVRNSTTGELVFSKEKLPKWSRKVVISPDNRKVAICFNEDEHPLMIWDMQTGEMVCKPLKKLISLPARPNMIEDAHEIHYPGLADSIEFSPDGRHLLTGGNFHNICLWDLKTGEAVGDGMGLKYQNQLQCGAQMAEFTPDGTRLITACEAVPEIYIWDVELERMVGHPLVVADSKNRRIEAIKLSPDGTHLAIAHGNRQVTIWDIKSRQRLGEPIKSHWNDLVSVDFSPDGSMLLVGSEDGVVSMWHLKHITSGLAAGGTIERDLPVLDERPRFLSGNINAQRFVTIDDNRNEIQLWDMKTGGPLGSRILIDTKSGPVSGGALSSDGSLLAISTGNTISLWDMATGLPKGKGFQQPEGDILEMLFRKKDLVLVSRSLNTLHFWDIVSGKPLRQSVTHKINILSMAADPSSEAMVLGATNRCVYLQENPDQVESFNKICSFEYDEPYGLEFSRDGEVLAVSLGHEVWDQIYIRKMQRINMETKVPMGQEIWPDDVNSCNINRSAISADHGFLATSLYDGGVRIFHTITGQVLRNLQVGKVAWMSFDEHSGKLVMLVARDDTDGEGPEAEQQPHQPRPGWWQDVKGWDKVVERIITFDLKDLGTTHDKDINLIGYITGSYFNLTEDGLVPVPAMNMNLYEEKMTDDRFPAPVGVLATLPINDIEAILGRLVQAGNWPMFLRVFKERKVELTASSRLAYTKILLSMAGAEARKKSSAIADAVFTDLNSCLDPELLGSGNLDLDMLGLCQTLVYMNDRRRADLYWEDLTEVLISLDYEMRDRCRQIILNADQ